MKKLQGIILILISIIIISDNALGYGDYYQKSKRGWFWFEDKDIVEGEKEKNDAINKPSASNVQDQDTSATKELEKFQKELEEAKAAMIMRPSVENTIKFIKYQNEMFAKADIVSANWQDALLAEPSLNIARGIPISQAGAKIRSRAEAEDNKQLLKNFAKKFKLLFFYKGQCVYCSNFAQVLEVFAKRYGFKVSAVTADKGRIAKFPAQDRADLIEKLGVDFYPSVFAYSDELGIAVPVSSGFIAIDELEKHAAYVANKLKERLKE